MLRLFIIQVFLLMAAEYSLNAQDFNNYQPLKSQGKIPSDFLTLSSEVYKSESEKISKENKQSEKKAKKRFHLENSFELRDILFSGKILFNDPVSIYLNKVADKLLEHNQELRSKLRFYAVKSPHVNAFATNSGMIFVNLGLISQLETESQLAYILAHEIIHYQKGHVIESYVETTKIIKGKGAYKKLSHQDKLLAKNNYSKEMESEADQEGMNLFLKSSYSTEKVLGVFDVLQYAYLPFDDIAFDKDFFEKDHLILPQEYFVESTAPIVEPEDEDDSKSSHPSIKTRRSYIQNKISTQNNEAKKNFLVDENEFITVRKISRYEIAYLYLLNLNYEKAIYQAYLLLKEDVNNLYLKKVVAKALYSMCIYYNNGNQFNVHENFANVEGSSQQVHHLFEKIDTKELNVVALKYCWDLKKQFPEDKEINLIVEDLFKELVYNHFESKDEFSYTPKEELTKIIATIEDSASSNNLGKYDKIKLNQNKQKTEEEHNFIYFAFVNNLQDPLFVSTFDKYTEQKRTKNKKPEETKKEKKERIKREEKEERIRKRKGDALGIDTLVVFNPFYQKIDHRKKYSKKYIETEAAEINLTTKIKENSRRTGVELIVLDDMSFKEDEVERFNDFAFLNQFLIENFQHSDHSITLTNIHKDYTDKLIQKYKTNNFCWMGVANYRNKKQSVGFYLIASILMYPTLPFGIAYAVTPDWDTYYYCLIIDINTGKLTYVRADLIDARDKNSILNSTIYDTFYQIKNKR